MAAQSSESVSVIIVTHNSLPLFENCLNSLKAAFAAIAGEVIVVDNKSTDHSPSVAKRHLPDATVITNRENKGFAGGCNQGAGLANSRYLLFLNPDVEIDADAIPEMISAVNSREKVGLVSGRLRYPDGRFQPTCRWFPTVSNLFFSRGSFVGRFLHRAGKSVGRYVYPDTNKIIPVQAVAGAMVMIRRDVFERVGGFDDRYFMYMEDTDLSYRLIQAGFVNLFAPDAGAVHHWRHGSDAGLRKRHWWHHRSVWRYFRKHHPEPLKLIALWVLLAGNLTINMIAPGRRGKTA